jgi:hypothetical protein
LKKLELGQTLQLLGNVVVIVGILLLAYELNQNQRMTQAQTRATLSQSSSDALFRVSETEALSDLWFRGLYGANLSEQEQRRFGYLFGAWMRRQENVHYQYRMGLYDAGEFDAQKNSWRGLYSLPGAAAEFCTYRASYSPEYIREIESLLEAPCE